MRSLPPDERSVNAHLNLNMDGTIKALGIQWNLGTDEFEYNNKTSHSNEHVTKRHILSDIQKLFDPLGWIAPCVLQAKIFIQRLWRTKVTWDDRISPSLADEWNKIKADLENVNDIRINRWVDTLSTDKANIQVQGFSDASIHAYGASVYIRVEKPDGTIKTNLIASRTKVALVKTIFLPRLELCGAMILSKLLKQVSQAMRIPDTQLFAWTDSSIVISWILGEPQKWKTFVANRVVEITGNVNPKQWYHVLSQDNPADIASRGMFLSELKTSKLWWHGPKWLSMRDIEYTRPNELNTDMERRTIIQSNLSVEYDDPSTKLTTQFSGFDSLQELLKTISFCRKFLNMKKEPITDINPTTHDLQQALHICVQIVQREEFSEEINRLQANQNVKANSKLKTLNPFLSEGILRVGGRLRHASLNNDSKHPIILGNKNNLSGQCSL